MVRIIFKHNLMFGMYIDYIDRNEAENIMDSLGDDYGNIIVDSTDDIKKIGLCPDDVIMIDNDILNEIENDDCSTEDEEICDEDLSESDNESI